MPNKFTNTRSWVIASLLAAGSLFGQSEIADDSSCAPKAPEKCAPQKAPEPKPNCNPKPACPPKPCCPERPELKLNCAYNAPARVEVDSCSCWDFYAGASFIYWEAMQDNMEYAASLSTDISNFFFETGSGDVTSAEIYGHNFKYKPGFKAMIGMNFDSDHWEGYAEYTWFSSKTFSSANGSDTATEAGGVTPVRGNPSMLFDISFGVASATAFNNGSQEWQLSFQSLDTAIARTYYVGTKLTFRSIMGARFAWFSQQLEQEFTGNGKLTLAPIATPYSYTMKQNFSSWGAGLMGGLNTSWLLGEGFSMIGNGSLDLLYTRMQTTNTKFKWTATGPAPAVFDFPDDRPDFVMPHMNLEFGFAWGSYFACYNWHVDFAATYNFQVFWGANRFRDFTDRQAAMSMAPAGNLYMHGLNVSARLDF